MKSVAINLVLFFTIGRDVLGQNFLERFTMEEIEPGLIYYQLLTDTLFDSNQEIYILGIKNESNFEFNVGYSDSILLKTSVFADSLNAVAAINGGFFDTQKGGSVNYLEEAGEVISLTRKEEESKAISGKTMNGAVVLDTQDNLQLETRQSDEFYSDSEGEQFVLITGPLLIQEGKDYPLPDTKFVNDRHPRSCLCITSDQALLIVVDGRSETGFGMSLHELQSLLRWIECKDAVNLDGGGSSTLWVKSRGILNHPSDKTGERPVANVIIIRKF